MKFPKLASSVLGLMLVLLVSVTSVSSQEGKTVALTPPSGPLSGKELSLEEFLRLTAQNDTAFAEILIDELTLKYRKDLLLPAGDLVFGILSNHKAVLIQDQNSPDLSVSLSKLFPKLGTTVTAEYATDPVFASRPEDFSREYDRSSEYTVTVTQPIAENAFGHVTRLRDKIIGIENNVLTYQIIEAYEDYLALVLVAYLDWYEAFENLKVAESSYKENLKLLDNVKERRKSNIALPIDVNKITLQVMAREEVLIESRVRYQNAFNLVMTAIRDKGGEAWIPQVPKLYEDLQPSFQEDYEAFQAGSRTFGILDLLEKKSSLEVRRNANELLPSIDLKVGVTSSWGQLGIHKEESILFAGVTLDWPFPDEVERADYKTSKILRDKSELTTQNTYYRLYTDVKNLYEQIERERKLLAIAEERIKLAQEVFDAEAENYAYGKVTLNDYIDAVNALDNNRFNRVFHLVQQKKLIVESLRILDRLVAKEEIPHAWSS